MNARRKERRAKRQSHAAINKLVQMVTGRLVAGDTAIRFYNAPPAAPGVKTVEIEPGGAVTTTSTDTETAVRMIERARLRLGCKASDLHVISAGRLSRALISNKKVGPIIQKDPSASKVENMFFASGHRDAIPPESDERRFWVPVNASPERPRRFTEGGAIKRALICACGCRGPFTADYCPDCDRPIS